MKASGESSRIANESSGDNEYIELTKRASCGDAAAMEAIFKRGDDLASKGDFEAAANMYRHAATVYRVDAYRTKQRSISEETISRLLAEEKVIRDSYCQWIVKNPTGPREAPIRGSSLKWNDIRSQFHRIVATDQRMRKLALHFQRIYDTEIVCWTGDGASPLELMLGDYFEVRASPWREPENIEMRIVVDLFADKLLTKL